MPPPSLDDSLPNDRKPEPGPSVTVTFLFTDIEGSTGLWEQYPEAMKAVLARHDAILREAVEAHEGRIIKTLGDGVHAAFATAAEGAAAVLAAQQALFAEGWEGIKPHVIRVRMALHACKAEARGGDYFGPDLNRVARLMSVGHGGQTLLSATTADLVRDRLPSGATLRDLGEHRLKDLVRAERVYQLVHSGLPIDFPPLKSLNAFRNNLPVQLTSFVGRQTEVRILKDFLLREDVRLVTLTGPGGVGKTRLALQATADLIDRFADGVFFVDLAPAREPEDVLAAVARTIGLRETSDLPLLEKVKGELRDKAMLLVLDNFEQVVSAAPNLGEFLHECPRLHLLVTSREVLHLRGEQVLPVPPLGLPRAGFKQPSLDQLRQSEAIRLFIERARAVKPEFELTDETASAVAEICWRLDGLPLAIELATARVRLFSPQALLERLKSRLKLLRGGPRDLPVRQQTLRDAIGWNYELLDRGEQRLFTLLSVFPGCTLEAVEGVAGRVRLDEVGVDILDGVSSLVDKSLIRRADQGPGEPRFLMLETIREYAVERLEEDGDFGMTARRAHAAWYADFTLRQWKRMTGAGRETALGDMEREIENVQAAWRYWVTEGDLEQLRKLADCLWLLYDARGWYYAMADSTGDLLKVLTSTPSTPERAQEEIMLRVSLARAMMSVQGCTPDVEATYTGALSLCQGQGEIPQLFPVLRGLASYYMYVADFEKGARMGRQILGLAERRDDSILRVEGHLVLGYNLAFLKSLRLGLDHLDKGIANYDPGQHSRRLQPGHNPIVACYSTSALILWMLGFPDRALERTNEAVAVADRLNRPFSMAYALFHAGLLHLWRRELEFVQERAEAVLEITEKHDFPIWAAVAGCLRGVALAGMGRMEEGLAQSDQSMALCRGLRTPPVFWPLLLTIRAGLLGQARRPKEGLALVDEALGFVTPESGNTLAAEFCRVKGELLLASASENMGEAETCFQQALRIAREREAGMFELRAAGSLCRLWRGREKVEEGRQLLRDVCGKFTEGFATTDLQEATELLKG